MDAKRFIYAITLILLTATCLSAGPVPDTGQTTKYTSTFGEDADYTINPPSYTKLGYNGVELPDTATPADGWIMTRDNVTGLIWEMKTNDGSVHDRDNIYTWANTATFIAYVNDEDFGGFSDWRMPTVKELSTLVNSNRINPSINTIFFPDGVSSGIHSVYWSSTTYASRSVFAWYVSFYGGHASNLGKSSGCYVRAVRAGQ